MIEIVLPLPHKNLSPNARCHWRAKAAATKKARSDASWAALAGIADRNWNQPLWGTATVQATFYFRDKRRRDRDNMLSSCKAYFDGLADSGLIANDSGLTHLPVKVEIDKANPRVVLTVTPS